MSNKSNRQVNVFRFLSGATTVEFRGYSKKGAKVEIKKKVFRKPSLSSMARLNHLTAHYQPAANWLSIEADYISTTVDFTKVCFMSPVEVALLEGTDER